MKITLKLLFVGILAALCCSVGNAQIIYSNNFSLGTGVNISNTPPTYAATYAGGSSSAVWLDVNGSATAHGTLLDNGIVNSVQSDYWALPFKPQTNHVYLLTVILAFTNNPGIAAEFGYSINTTLTNYNGDARFNGSVNGYDWMAPLYSAGNPEFFAGNKTANALANASNLFPPGVGTNTFQIILDTRGGAGGTNWVAAGCINGVGVNGTFTYTPALYVQVTNLTSVGISQNGTATLPTAAQYQSFVLETTLKPFIVGQPVASSIASGNGIWTNAVTVLADTNGGQLSYQWYANGAPLVNGVNGVSGANTNILKINPITPANEFTNYFAVVTNNFGSATSSLASVVVLTNPVITSPLTPSNSITLFSGSGGNVGSSPTFLVSASGAPSLDYRWYTNGVQVGGAGAFNANSSSISFTNLQATGPTNFACVVSNGFSEVTNTWYATYLATPTAAYPQAVLGALPFDFWRLNESDDGLGNKGALCHDYQSGNNGVYTNLDLGQTGYDPSEPSETSAEIGTFSAQYSYAGRIHGADFAAPSGSNAEFTVEAWAEGFADNAGAPVVTEGTFNLNEEFGLGSSTNPSTLYQFYVRGANNTVYKAVSSIPVNDFTWHHLVGVCDQTNGILTLYVDGMVAATTNIPAGTGIIEASAPLTIGAGIASGQTDYGTSSALEFDGFIDDVATYKYALSPGQVVNHYASVPGNFVPVSFVTPPPLATFPYQANQTLTIPITAVGSASLGYYWTNVTAGGVVASGQTDIPGNLNATLTIPNAPTSLSGDQLELVVTNSGSSTNLFVTLLNPAPPVTLDYSSPILYSNSFNGGTWQLAGTAATAANALVGGTNSVWADILGTNNTGTLYANGSDTTTFGDSWILPFQPHPGYVYTLTASLTLNGNPSSWTGIGFGSAYVNTNASNVNQNGGVNHGRFTDDVSKGYDWTALTESSSNLQYFAGPDTGAPSISSNAFFAPNTGTHIITVVLDTTTNAWRFYASVDSKSTVITNYPATNLPTIGAVGITQTAITAPNFIQWNNFVLTQVAPSGGVAPYVLNSLPASVTLLADSPLSILATNFGSAPFGYYWSNTNTAAVLASGTSSSLTPLSANLTVSDVPVSWNGNTLALVMTNAYGTNISLVSVIVTNAVIIPTIPPTITGFSLVSGTNVTINATNGQSGGTYYLLGTTNLTTPRNQWLPVATNVILTNGSAANGFTFIGTNVIRTNNPQQFYILSSTNN